ncbi:MAG: zinc-dependent metalloprotease [Alphaproteobacteria bacterium]
MNLRGNPWIAAALALCLWAASPAVLAQEGSGGSAKQAENDENGEKGGNGKNGDKKDKKDKKGKTLEKFVEDFEVKEGLFTLYRDKESGKLYMAVREDQITGEDGSPREYVYFTHTADGVLEGGHFRGSYRDNRVFTFNRHYETLEIVSQNTFFWFDPESALSRAADANITPAVLTAEKIKAKSEDGKTFLIEADPIFTSEALHQVEPSPPRPEPGQRPEPRFELGSLAKKRTKIAEVRNYPANTDVVVDYVFANPKPRVRGSLAVTDPRSVTIRVQHSIIEMPENGYKPRFDDHRVGYFTDRVTDLTDPGATPYRDLITRWRLEKKDPEADVSEPVEPITWWIENTTPVEYRETIRQAALAWNEAFEAAGFENAIEVKVQPDDAGWDAGDIRYNVLRWTSSPNPPFGGYGPSFTNPRTGEIIGADVMLEYVFLTNRLAYDKLFEKAALFQERIEAADKAHTHDRHALQSHCSLGARMQMNTLFGLIALRAQGAGAAAEKRLVKESIYYLILHELGHTLGLTHNMKASQLHGIAEIHDRELAEKVGLTGSVMDYPAINFAPPGKDQGGYYTVKPGPYDIWAIRFGYAPEMADEAKRKALLAESTKPEHAYGNDADDMRSPGRGIDPRIMIGDLSGDAMDYAVDQIRLVRATMEKIRDKYAEDGSNWQELVNAYLILTGYQANSLAVISRYVGGVHVDRALAGQKGGGTPYTPVAREDQKKAMKALAEYAFAPDAFAAPDDLYSHLQPLRRGFDFFEENEDPDIHARVLTIQKLILAHLLHPVTLERITDSRLYGNEYPAVEMMDDLTGAVFKADIGGPVSTQRQNLQVAYVTGLAGIVGNSMTYDPVSRSAALRQLKTIRRMTAPAWFTSPPPATQAHRDHIRLIIRKALDD